MRQSTAGHFVAPDSKEHAIQGRSSCTWIVMADCACLSEAAPRDFLGLGRNVLQVLLVYWTNTFARAMRTGGPWAFCDQVPRYLCSTERSEALAGVGLQPWVMAQEDARAKCR